MHPGSNCARIRNPFPGRVDAVVERIRHRSAAQKLEILLSRTAPRRAADALAFMHAQTGRCDLGECLAQKRIESARFQTCQAGRIERLVAILEKERRRVPDEARWLPHFDEV